jgi:hypothetical protein
MHFNAATDAGEQRNGKFAPEMLAEFFEAIEKEPITRRARLLHEGIEEGEAEFFHESENASRRLGGKHSVSVAVEGVERDSEGDSRSVGNGKIRELLQFVGGPMAEIERTGGAEFKGIARFRDVLDVEFGATPDDSFEGFGFKVREAIGEAFDFAEKSGVSDQGDFDRLNQAGALFGGGEIFKELGIVDNGKRG